MTTHPAHLEPSESDRGLVYLPEIVLANLGSVRVREASSDKPTLWLDVRWNGVDLHLPLAAEDAWKLADQLRCGVENHYQGDARPAWAKANDTGPCTWCEEAQSPRYLAHEGHDPECPSVVAS